MTEAEIYQDFKNHGLTVIDAIERLERIGYTAKEAEQIVFEWQDALTENHR